MIHVPSQVLLMSEDGTYDQPLWDYSDGSGGGHSDGDMGLSAEVRSRLLRWNTAFIDAEVEFDFDGVPIPIELFVRAFQLAAEVQRELGDECVVWCVGGSGLGALRRTYLSRGGDVLVLTASDAGLIVRVTADGLTREPLDDLGVDKTLADRVRAWQLGTRRIVRYASSLDVPAGAQARSEGLEIAAALQLAVGRARRVFFIGGADPFLDPRGVLHGFEIPSRDARWSPSSEEF